MIDWSVAVPIILAVVGLTFGLYKWTVHRADKKHEVHEKRFAEHHQRFDRHETRIEKNEKLLGKTRDELHRDYVRSDQMDRMLKKVGDEFDQVHIRLGGIAKDLNQAIGNIQASSDAEMKNLVSEIKDAIKHRNDQ
ncbi:MAG: hypothetical protein ABW146_08510 [Candidatus Sedimenticola sp. 6PFRAG7]